MRDNIGLYKGKRKDNGERIEGSLIVIDKRYFIVNSTISDLSGGYKVISSDKRQSGYFYDVRCIVEVIPETVGEYTGLTDKNGKKIFEGDIVRYYGTYDLEVYIEKGHTKIRWVDTVTGLTGTELFFGYDEEAYGECEIIGTIHDNPELLKGGVDNG